MSDQLDDMYRDVILDHYRSPRGKNPLPRVDIHSDGSNPACGDELDMDVQMDGDVVRDVHVSCKGCAISVASGSMLAEIVKGRPLSEVKRIAELVRKMLKGEEVDVGAQRVRELSTGLGGVLPDVEVGDEAGGDCEPTPDGDGVDAHPV